MDNEELRLIRKIVRNKYELHITNRTDSTDSFIRYGIFVLSRKFPSDSSFSLSQGGTLFYDPCTQDFGSTYHMALSDVMFNLKDVKDILYFEENSDATFNMLVTYTPKLINVIMYAVQYIELNPEAYCCFRIEAINHYILDRLNDERFKIPTS